MVAQTRQIDNAPAPPYDTAGVKGDQVFIQKGSQVYLVALEVFPIATRYSVSWNRPGQILQQDPTKEHTTILEHGNGIYIGVIGFGETNDDTSGFMLDRWFRVLDLRAGITNIPLFDRPAARGLGAAGRPVSVAAVAGGGFYEGLWEITVTGEDAVKTGEWLSDGKRTYEVYHAENVGGGTRMVLWPNIRLSNTTRLYPAFSIRARYTPEAPAVVPRVGETFQRSTYDWEEVVE